MRQIRAVEAAFWFSAVIKRGLELAFPGGQVILGTYCTCPTSPPLRPSPLPQMLPLSLPTRPRSTVSPSFSAWKRAATLSAPPDLERPSQSQTLAAASPALALSFAHSRRRRQPTASVRHHLWNKLRSKRCLPMASVRRQRAVPPQSGLRGAGRCQDDKMNKICCLHQKHWFLLINQ